MYGMSWTDHLIEVVQGHQQECQVQTVLNEYVAGIPRSSQPGCSAGADGKYAIPHMCCRPIALKSFARFSSGKA